MVSSSKILTNEFIAKYAKTPPKWGFGALSEITYARTYARPTAFGGKERWYQCLERVVNGTFQMKHEHLNKNNLPINFDKDITTAEEMYDRMFNFKILPPGRGLWIMGTTLTTHSDHSKRLYAALNNCAFVSTGNIAKDLSKPFRFAIDLLMLGVGMGVDLKGAGKIDILKPLTSFTETYTVEDSREGWVDSLGCLIDSYLIPGKNTIEFNYDLVRPKGLPIKKFGGISSGPDPLRELHENVRGVLEKNVGKPITLTTIADIINMTGVCVVSGNVRRSAEILLGDDSDEFLTLKDWEKRPERAGHAWCSNNSIVVDDNNVDKLDYGAIAKSIQFNAEPGLFHLDNARKYGRMVDGIDNVDYRVKGTNPCVEQTLNSWELCCLVETFISHHTDLDDYKRSLELAFEYAKIVTLGQTHWKETNAEMLRNRRIGCSMSGVAEFIERDGMDTFKTWLDEGYKHIKQFDTKISDELCIRESIKKTSIKPSGTVSLVAGCSSGIHYSQSKYYTRRMRIAKNNELVPLLVASGIHVEDSVTDKYSVVASFIVKSKEDRFVKDVTMREQLSIAALIQKYYADNAVSCTITFDQKKDTVEDIKSAIDDFLPQLKCLSMLPLLDPKSTVYPQMPLSDLTEEQYLEANAKITTLDLSGFYGDHEVDYLDDTELSGEDYKLKRASADDLRKKFDLKNEEQHDVSHTLDIPEAEKFCSNGSCQIQIPQEIGSTMTDENESTMVEKGEPIAASG